VNIQEKTTTSETITEAIGNHNEIANNENVIKFFATLLKINKRIQKYGQTQN
jgi:hypothetical protein